MDSFMNFKYLLIRFFFQNYENVIVMGYFKNDFNQSTSTDQATAKDLYKMFDLNCLVKEKLIIQNVIH